MDATAAMLQTASRGAVSHAAIDPRERFLLALSYAMAVYGIPAHRLEEAAAGCAVYLGLEAQIFATPTAVFAAIGGAGDQRTHLLRLSPGEVNVEKQSLVDEVLRDVLAGKLEPDPATDRLDEIIARPARYGAFPLIVCQTIVSMTAAVFFRGGWAEVGAAAAVGLLVGMLCVLATVHRRVSRVIEFASGFFAALGAAVISVWVHPVGTPVVVLAGVIVLVPGLTLTTAVSELATRHLAAGTARLMGALTIFMMIGFGVAIGQGVGDRLLGAAAVVTTPVPVWAAWVALFAAPPALTVLFQAAPRDVRIILPVGVLGYLGARAGAGWFGPEIGVCVGAFAVGVVSNLYARLADRPSGVAMIPGIMLLVPGGLGFRSVTSFAQGDELGGLGAAVSMVLVATGLVVGLILANVALPPRRAL